MERYIAKLSEYLEQTIDDLRMKFISSNVSLKKGNITFLQYRKDIDTIHYVNNLTSNIMRYFEDDCSDILGYISELSLHLVAPTFTSKEVYLILRYVIDKNYRNMKNISDKIPSLERLQEFEFKSMPRWQINSLIESDRIYSLLEGNAEKVTKEEEAFLEEYNENLDKFNVSTGEFKRKTKVAYDLIDKFERYPEFEDALKDIGVTDECVQCVHEYLLYRASRRSKDVESPYVKKEKGGNMVIVDKYLTILKSVKESAREEERSCNLRSIMENKNDVGEDVTETYLVNEFTGKSVTEEIDEIIKYFSYEDDEYISKKIFFRDFLRTTFYLDRNFGFTPKEAFQLISLLTERNYKIASLSDTRMIFDHEALRKIDFKTITHKEIEHIFKTPLLLQKFYTDKGLTEEEKAQKSEISEHFDEFIQDYTEFCNVNDAFYLGFVTMFPNIDLSDIVNASEDLRMLEVKDSVVDSLVNYFISVFRAGLQKSTLIFDINETKGHLNKLNLDEKNKKLFIEEIERHNDMVTKRLEREKESLNRIDNGEDTRKKVLTEPKKYLNEKEVRDLTKYIRRFLDMYRVKIVNMPNYQELLQCINNLEILEEDHFAISRIISLVVSKILNLNPPKEGEEEETYDDYLSSYDELITLVSYLIKYKIERDKIDAIIRKYKHLKERSTDLVSFLKESLDEISLYDASLGDDIKDLLGELDVSNEEDYEAIISLLEECKKSAKKYSMQTDYEYHLGLKTLGR